MGCGCGKPRRSFEHVALDGTVTVLDSQYEAIRMVAKAGGTWRLKG